jgi:hypothetical protein
MSLAEVAKPAKNLKVAYVIRPEACDWLHVVNFGLRKRANIIVIWLKRIRTPVTQFCGKNQAAVIAPVALATE